MADLALLDQAILRTIAYFDVFEYPLTAAEVWRWLYRGAGETWMATTEEISARLTILVADKKIDQQDDYFALPGRVGFAKQRSERQAQSDKKWRRAKTVAQFVEIFPFVKFAGVVNTLAINNAKTESDIDLLVIGQPGQLWVARMMVTGIVELLGYRRHADNIADRVCLSFYLSTNALDLRPLALSSNDHHLQFWATQVVPLMDDGIYAKYREANRDFTSRLPNAWPTETQARQLKPRKFMRGVKRMLESSFGGARGAYLETMSRDYQHKRMDKNIHSKAKLETTDVVISDDVLKFHEDDRRARYNQAYEERCQKLGIKP